MPGKKLTAKDLEIFEKQLRLMLGVLDGDIDRLEAEALQSASKSSTEEGDGYFQEFSLELLQRDETALQEVLDALERIRSGDFGKCEGCASWIRKERLKAVPHARNCIDCQRELEAAG
jgi:RNA polymerase-binding transcription factor DksA